VKLCGVLTGIQRKRNKEGKPWAAMVLEDRTGSVEALVFATSYERLAAEVMEDQVVLVTALALPEENGPPKVSVQNIIPLDVARVDFASVISIRVWLGRNAEMDRAKPSKSCSAENPVTPRCAFAWKPRGFFGPVGCAGQSPPRQGIPLAGGSHLRRRIN